jgi:phosphoglycerate dehydrogenase-like enzyme
MNPIRPSGTFVLFTVLAAALGLGSASAEVRILVPAEFEEELAGLQDGLPELEIVYAEPQDLVARVADCDGVVIRGYSQEWSQELLRAGKQLKWVHSYSAGVEHIVRVPEMKDSDIVLTNAKIIQGPEIGDHALGLLLFHTRNLKQYNRAMVDGSWMEPGPTRLPVIELPGKTMLIVGLGGIGTQVAVRAAAFGMRILAVDPKDMPFTRDVEYVGKPDELLDLLPEADVVVSALPHTTASEGVFGKEQFDAMKDGVYFINVSRGKVMQMDALVAALNSGKIRAAGLDVVDPEPLPADHPLWSMDNVILTPHMATVSDKIRGRHIKLLRDNIERFATGRPLRNVVNKAVEY